MIGKITTGKDFRGLVNYLLDPTKTPQILDTNLSWLDRNDMIWELDTCAKQRPNCKKPVKHISLSFAPDDGHLLDQTILDITDAVISGLGYDNNQILVVKHGRVDPEHDRAHDHDHVHILINAIDYDGKRVTDSFDQTKLERILREQEQKHNLTTVPPSAQRNYKAPSTGQVRRMMREIEEYKSGRRKNQPQAPYMSKIQSGIDLASHDKPNLTVFLARLQQLGIEPKFRIEENNIKGISYKMQDFKVRGCKLHRASLPQLLEHRVILDEERDQVAIALVNAGEKLELAPELEVSWSQTNIRDYVPYTVQTMLREVFGSSQVELERERRERRQQNIQLESGNNQEQWQID